MMKVTTRCEMVLALSSNDGCGGVGGGTENLITYPNNENPHLLCVIFFVRSCLQPQTASAIMNVIITKTRIISEDRRVAKRGKKSAVAFSEMLRLMNTYGSVKCLRNHHKKKGDDINNAKDDSVRRKFYRWFPDLDERFERDSEGLYHPKLGHEFEVDYRERMRKLDGEVLAAKRTGSRKEHLINPKRPKQSHKGSKKAMILDRACRASILTVSSNDGASPTPVLSALPAQEKDGMVASTLLNFHENLQESAAIISDIEPLDLSFIAEAGIFDDVETSFFSSTSQECPSSRLCPCSPTPENVGLNHSNKISPMSESNYDTPFIDGILGQSLDERSWGRDNDSDISYFNYFESIEECYENVLLVSDDSDIASGALSDDSWELFD